MKAFKGAIFLGAMLAVVAMTWNGSAADRPTPQPLDQAGLFREWNGGTCLGATPPRKEWLAAAAAGGIKSINLMVNFPAHASADKPYTIDGAYLKSWVDTLDQAKASHLRVLLSIFPYEALMKDPEANEDRFVALWEQLAKTLESQPATVAFELFPEPYGKLDADHWNKLVARTVAAIRQTNPDRLLVIGPARYYSDFAHLHLPDDPHLAVAFHMWLRGKEVWEGTDAQKKAITDALDHMVDWGRQFKCPVILTQFGMNVGNGDVESHLRWVSVVARAAEARSIPWIYASWNGGNFGVYDSKANQLRAAVVQALLPTAGSTIAAPTSGPSTEPAAQPKSGGDKPVESSGHK